MYEVELKFPVTDRGGLERGLVALGARFAPGVEQVDRYFTHPCRDFAATDEAVRLRRVGDAVAITWKGPRIDATTKTRREIELPVGPADAACASGATTIARWTDLLGALGFEPVRDVAKRRRTAALRRDGADIEAAIDDVDGLGCFLELEERTDGPGLERARQRLAGIARELGCGSPERRSYLELLIAAAAP